ncbi:MAG TPA: NAD-dependent epimerase/dehydratase family protein [Acidimicrobiales bacterium]|nr:NAD-dependent epimerase/dehydratase family protein [Acidimicrobiales bacterium]
MTIAVVTGAGGLIGSEAVRHFASIGLDVVGIDNDMRRVFFGEKASTRSHVDDLEQTVPGYAHRWLDIRDRDGVFALFETLGDRVALVVHAAAQPSHDWSATDPITDFEVNALGTMHLLEATRRHAPEAVFIFTSTNKVYGDAPNHLPLHETETRFEIDQSHPFAAGITEEMSIDTSMHSPFGASKVAADVAVQEYGRYFGLRTSCFRGGTLTGPQHEGAELHGFLSYLVRCAAWGDPYVIHGYGGKQVRDAIHSHDLITAFDAVFAAPPPPGSVFNIGGGRANSCSVLEAIGIVERVTGRSFETTYDPEARVGDHLWWIGSNSRFEASYPHWKLEYDVEEIITEIWHAHRA